MGLQYQRLWVGNPPLKSQQSFYTYAFLHFLTHAVLMDGRGDGETERQTERQKTLLWSRMSANKYQKTPSGRRGIDQYNEILSSAR